METEPGTALTPTDFSKEAVGKAVLKKVATNPFAIGSTALGVVGLAALLAGTAWPPLLIYGLITGIVAGGGVFAFDYYGRFDVNAQNYIETMRSMQRRLVADIPKRLGADLKAAGSDRGVRQLKELEESFQDFQELLKRKFSTRGMTLNRFLGTAEQVHAGALYKLQMVLDQMKAVESIPEDLGKQAKNQKSNGDQTRFIQERVGHRTEALEAIENLHTNVEESLTRLSEISVRLAKVGMDQDEETKYEACLDDLRALATQAPSMRKEV